MVRFWNFACLKSGHTYIKFYNPTFIFFFTNFSPDLIFYFNSKFHSYGHTTCQCSQGWKWHFMSKIKGTKKLVSAHLTEPQGHNKKKNIKTNAALNRDIAPPIISCHLTIMTSLVTSFTSMSAPIPQNTFVRITWRCREQGKCKNEIMFKYGGGPQIVEVPFKWFSDT